MRRSRSKMQQEKRRWRKPTPNMFTVRQWARRLINPEKCLEEIHKALSAEFGSKLTFQLQLEDNRQSIVCQITDSTHARDVRSTMRKIIDRQIAFEQAPSPSHRRSGSRGKKHGNRRASQFGYQRT